ncbi:MAG: DUF4038 domain-containing protein [Spirochaetaceae bacterium]|nr:DUF4038 domain-containing protein [Spirochaetaceae bacterium]
MSIIRESLDGSGSSLRVSDRGDSLVRADGNPFFWLGDTAWLANAKLAREEMVVYLDDRSAKGFTVIQVMALHRLEVENAYGDRAVPDGFLALAESGKLDSGKALAGDGFWETLDFLVDAAAERGIYSAIVPVWGSVVADGSVSVDAAKGYASLLADRYRSKPGIVWMNGGDLRGSVKREVWEAIGETLKAEDPHHLITYHPFGRTSSATWFHRARWLDFNMFQSGHRDYGQRTPETEVAGEDLWRGEDNWSYVLDDISLVPRKPTLDGEPSYEDIPHGLHDPSQPRWTDADCRRYAYWSLLAGAFGHTYGHNSIMQFHRASEPMGSYGATRDWLEALGDPGAIQMIHVRRLIEALGGGPLEYAPELLADEGGERYARRLAARAGGRGVAYLYSGGAVGIVREALGVGELKAWWFDPRSGALLAAAEAGPPAARIYVAPGPEKPGNDWVLVVEPAAVRPSFDERLAR